MFPLDGTSVLSAAHDWMVMPMTKDDLARRRKRDAEIDANGKLERETLCYKCRYRLLDVTYRVVEGCNYASVTGHLRDRGNGPGDCRSFEPIDLSEKKKRSNS